MGSCSLCFPWGCVCQGGLRPERRWAQWPWVLPEQSWLPGGLWPRCKGHFSRNSVYFVCKQLKSLWEQAVAPACVSRSAALSTTLTQGLPRT